MDGEGLRRSGLVASVAVVMAVIVLLILQIDRTPHTDVHIVNGLDSAVVVSLGDVDVEVASEGRSMVELEDGPVHVVCRTPAGATLEEFDRQLSFNGRTVVYNVAGAAPLYAQKVVYSRASQESRRHAASLGSVDWKFGTSWVELYRIHDPFVEPPGSVNAGAREYPVRMHCDVAEGGWRAACWIAFEEQSRAAAAEHAAHVVCAAGPEGVSLADAYAVIERLRSPEPALRYVERWQEERGTTETLAAFTAMLEQPLADIVPDQMFLSTREREVELGRLRELYTRRAFRPVTTSQDDPGTLTRFGGRPWLPEGEGWPACGECGYAMPLFLQLSPDALPESADTWLRAGLLQVFHCVHSGCAKPESSAPFSRRCKLVRVLDPAGRGSVAEEDLSPAGWLSAPLVRWDGADDLPSLAALGELEGPEAWRARVTYEDQDLVDMRYALHGDKLLGWPAWSQGVRRPECTTCGDPMEAAFQIASEQHVRYAWGDGGVAHVFVCPRHPRVVALTWESR